MAAAQSMKQQTTSTSQQKFTQKKPSIKSNGMNVGVPHLEMNKLEMNKLMQGASLDKKSGVNSIRNNTNRGNLGAVLASQKDIN